MHCVDPNCVSVCPVQALKKDPKTGIIHYDASVCTGCRYCMVACPFNIPKYAYDDKFGAIHKCELCNQKGVERLDKGGLPGCVEVCPTGAVIFGTREELLAEAKKRLTLKAGDEYGYPRQTLHSNDPNVIKVPKYESHIYGELEGGGTQVIVLSGVPYQNLGLPELDQLSTGARSEYVQHTLYKGMVLPLAALAGLSFLVYRNTKNDKHEGDDSNDDAS